MPILQVVFWGLLAVPIWAFAGYPFVMIARARGRFGEGPARGGGVAQKTVSVVVAARNEAPRIVARVHNLLRDLDYPPELLDVIVVCNGTADDTLAVCRSAFADEPRVRVIESPEVEGKAGSLNRGVAAAEGDIVVFADARQSFESDAVGLLMRWFERPGVGAVSGRLIVDAASDNAVRGVGSYWGLESRLRAAESATGSVVGCTGAVYAIRRDLYTPLPPATVLDDVLTPMRIALAGWSVRFESEAIAFDVASATAGREFERKVRTLAGNLQILQIERRLLSPTKNPLFLRYLSHRVLRVFAPLCLVLAMALGFFLSWIPYGLISAAVAGVFGMGLLGLAIQVRVLAPFAGFLVVNVAALLGLWRFLWSKGDVWKPTS